jgi:hypothetical protein
VMIIPMVFMGVADVMLGHVRSHVEAKGRAYLIRSIM